MRNLNLLAVGFFLLASGSGIAAILALLPKPQEWIAPPPPERGSRAKPSWYELAAAAPESQIARDEIAQFVTRRYFLATARAWSQKEAMEKAEAGLLPPGIAELAFAAWGGTRAKRAKGSPQGVSPIEYEAALARAIETLKGLEARQ
jgi:hypothetical protein